jgi:FtsP/CotA-like multicopper oxidase with cupredoxin domain
MNRRYNKAPLAVAAALALLAGTGPARAAVNVQCPGDLDGNATVDVAMPANIKCKHFTSGDGFAEMSDGHPMYTFGYADKTGTLPANVIAQGLLAARLPGPRIELEQGDELFLSLTNVGTVMRPDLFDPHSVHLHGFPNATPVFDGAKEASIAINQGSTLTYYYKLNQPGTYLYSGFAEAAEQMEMGMLGSLYVHPAQDATGCGGGVSSCPVATRKGGVAGSPRGYAYNDNDGSTAYDVEAPLQLAGFDSTFHDQHIQVQPLSFETLRTDYPLINGRGYPDTVLDDAHDDPDTQMTPPQNHDGTLWLDEGVDLNNGEVAQDQGAAIRVTVGDRLLLRLSNASVDRFYTVTVPGLRMKVVGTGARLMRGATGKNLYLDTASVNLGGGETHDVIVETAGVAPGTYFLTAAEFHQMSNKTGLDGGLITEILVQN